MSEEQRVDPHAHPSIKFYLAVAAILTVITVVEVAVFYIPAIHESMLLAPTLILLSSAKFAMVVMFYMHLKPDNRIYTLIFTAPLALAAIVILALMTLLGAW